MQRYVRAGAAREMELMVLYNTTVDSNNRVRTKGTNQNLKVARINKARSPSSAVLMWPITVQIRAFAHGLLVSRDCTTNLHLSYIPILNQESYHYNALSSSVKHYHHD